LSIHSDRRVRRVVTAARDDGRSYVETDELLPVALGEGGVRAVLWRTDEAPARNEAPEQRGADAGVTLGGSGGTVAIMVDIPPTEEMPQPSLEDLRRRGLHATADRHARHPLFHATDTLDYCLCVEGETHVLLDEGEVHLRAGDVLVQRGTQHAWDNRSGVPCRMLFVLIDAHPRRRSS
jgi:quercetin dioxygenase-like cupin family protein